MITKEYGHSDITKNQLKDFVNPKWGGEKAEESDRWREEMKKQGKQHRQDILNKFPFQKKTDQNTHLLTINLWKLDIIVKQK